MQRLENFCAMGSITIDSHGDRISLIFDPNEEKVSNDLSSTVQFIRNSLSEAMDALEQYLQQGLHWQHYPNTFFEQDAHEG